MFSFSAPAWLLLLLLLPASLFVYFVTLRRRGGLPFAYRVWGGHARGFLPRQPLVQVLVLASRICYVGTLVLLILALARPSWQRQQSVYLNGGAAILFLLDLSPSMAAVDTAPYTRLQQAKQAIRNFIASRTNDGIGLAGFGSEAALLWPISQHYAGAQQRLDDLAVLSLGQGTAIGLGLAVSASHLSKLPNPRKILIMLTDGGNNTGEILPEGAAQILRNQHIELYIIGLGQGGTKSALVTDPKTGRRFSAHLSQSYNPQRLRKIAAIAAGTFYSGRSDQQLRQNIAAIAIAEETPSKVAMRVLKQPLERQFIKAALLLFLLGAVIRLVILQEQLV